MNISVSSLSKFSRSAILLLFISLFLTHADMWLARRNFLFINQPTLLFVVFSLPASMALLISSPQRWLKAYTKNSLLVTSFFLLVFISILGAFLKSANWENSQYIWLPSYDCFVFLSTLSVAVSNTFRKNCKAYLLFSLLLLISSIFVDVLKPGFFSAFVHRTAGFAENPNTSAFVINMIMVMSIDIENLSKKDFLIIALSGAAIFTTLSRSGILIFFITCLTILSVQFKDFIGTKRFRVSFTSLIFVIFISASTLIGVNLIMKESANYRNSSAQDRLDKILGKDRFFETSDPRISLLMKSWDLIGESPLLGHGTGFTYSLPQGPHNIYLKQWIDNGILGLISYILLIGIALIVFCSRGYYSGFLFLEIVSIYGFFSHNILDNRSFLMLLGISASISLRR